MTSESRAGDVPRWLRQGASVLIVAAIAMALVLLAAALRVDGGGGESRSTPEGELTRVTAAREFAPSERAAAWLTTTGATPRVDTGRRTAQRPPSQRPPGRPIATLRWRGHEQTVVEGTGVAELRAGPGHYPDTPLPGANGNVAIAGHRTAHGAPFGDLDHLGAGDVITVETDRVYTYLVVATRIVAPDETWVAGHDPLGNGRPMLTLTTCHPKGSARQRLVVFAALRETSA